MLRSCVFDLPGLRRFGSKRKREVTKARQTLDCLQHLQVLDVKPQDVVVVKSKDCLSVEQCLRIREQIRALFDPEQKVLVLDCRLDLGVVRSPEVV